MKIHTLLAGLAVALLCSTLAHAMQTTIEVSLDGPQAGVPTSPGTGSATLVLDDVADTLHVSLTYSGLLAPTTNAHIHCCAAPGASADVIIPFVPPFVTGSTSGTFENTFAVTDAQEVQLLSGLSYINIHSTAFPLGEIRGQIVVPEPGQAALIVLGLVALGGRGWRRRAR